MNTGKLRVAARAGTAGRLLLGLAWIAATCVLFAQADRGSIEGTVTDPSGAAVPRAQIQVVNIDTNSTLDFSSNELGNYLAPNLPVGSYRMIVKKEGFRTLSREPILVRAQSSSRVDFTFQLGSLSDTIEITGEPPMLDVSATAVPSSLTNKFIDELQIILFGEKRNITDFLRYLPGNTSGYGALNSGEPAESWSPRVNSALQGATEIFVDGAPTSEWTARRGAVLENGPVIESVAEYTVVANAFNAEYGGFGSWFTSVTLRSGTNALHGKVFDYFGNDKMNARSFFQGTVQQKLRQNEGGFQFGGPVYIPKVYNGRNKTFLFFTQGLYYARLGGTGNLQTVPRADFKTGDFSNFLDASGKQIPIFDPGTTRPDGKGGFVRDQFPGNAIPSIRISPVSAKIAALLPDPDIPTKQTANWYNRTGAFPSFNTYTSTAKLDHGFSEKQKVSLTYSNQTRPRLINNAGWGWSAKAVPGLPNEPDVLEGFQTQTVTSQTWRLNHDYIFSPTVLNHLTLGADRYVNPYKNSSVGKGWDQALGITGMLDDLGAFPNINFSGGTGSPTGMGLTSNGLGAMTRYSVNESLTWIRGRHTMKFGAYHWRLSNNSRSQSNTAGQFNFSNQMTSQPDATSGQYSSWGSSVASFLLGELSGANMNLQYTTGYRFRYVGLFAQDDWRLTSKLTLSYGLRWDVALRPYEVQDKMSSFSPTAPNPVGINGALIFAGTGPGRAGTRFVETWMRGFAPRLGLAYSLNPKTIIRASTGIYYSDLTDSGGNTQGFTANPTINSPDGYTPAYNWGTSTFPASVIKRPPRLVPDFQNNNSIVWLVPSGTRLPQILTWTFAIQRELLPNLSLDVAYIGSHSTHLAAGTDFNFVDQKYLALGNVLSQPANSAAAVANGITLPFPTFMSFSKNNVAGALMPWPQYTSVGTGSTNDPVGRAHFNSLQVKVTKRYSNGLTVLAFWNWGKNMSSLNTRQYTAYRPVTYSQDTPAHTVVINCSYELPFGPQKKYLHSGNPALKWLASGWNLASYLRFTDGNPMSFTASNNLSFLGYSGKLANYVAGQPIFSSIKRSTFDPAVDRYFVAPTTAFVSPAPYEFGNTAPVLDWVRSWTRKAVSISVGKAFPITEKVHAQFRADANNPFNAVQWGDPNTGITSADFGRVTSAAEGRRIQLYLAVQF